MVISKTFFNKQLEEEKKYLRISKHFTLNLRTISRAVVMHTFSTNIQGVRGRTGGSP